MHILVVCPSSEYRCQATQLVIGVLYDKLCRAYCMQLLLSLSLQHICWHVDCVPAHKFVCVVRLFTEQTHNTTEQTHNTHTNWCAHSPRAVGPELWCINGRDHTVTADLDDCTGITSDRTVGQSLNNKFQFLRVTLRCCLGVYGTFNQRIGRSGQPRLDPWVAQICLSSLVR